MREKLDFNSGWYFKQGDEHLKEAPLKEAMYLEAKTERILRGYASRDYGKNREMLYENWQAVTLPHDFIITQEPEPENNNTLGFFKYDNAWYRKKFRVEESDMNRRLSIYFEGVATHATVYLNGCLMAHNFCGYTSFEVDITDMVKYGEENVLAVYVNTTDKHEGWWYSGGGIYRKVWLIKTDLVSVDLWGAYVHPEKRGNDWRIPVDVTVRNDDAVSRTVSVKAEIYDGDTEVCYSSGEITVAQKDKQDISLEMFIDEPKLWDCDAPNLYNAIIRIFDGETEIDTYKTRFGFRTLRFDPNHGFFLNEQPTKIKGVCCHEDYGLQGKAISDSVKRLRLERLREMGANGYRTAHYPHSETTFDYCDELGFLVMAETRWFESTKEGLEQLEMLVKAHRNNPSVIMWSLGNEEPLHNTPIGKRIFVTMREFARRFDNSRPFTTAVSHNPAQAPVMEEVDIIGINYNLNDYDSLHEKFPNKMIFASECCAVGSTRGWTYDDCPKRGYLHCYDNRSGWFMAREVTWKFLMAREWLGGGYQWAGIEHRGETEWPRLCSQSGALDLFLQKKDAFYQNKSHWCDEPIAHIIPNWNLSGREGEHIKVWVYTNCDEIELKLNGTVLGCCEIEKYGHAEFDVIYEPGRLEAVGYREGREVTVDVVETTGAPVSLELELQNKHPLTSYDTAVFNCYALDADGRRVPDAAPFVTFDTNSAGTIVGTGSDISDHNPVPTIDRKMRAGIIAICVKLNAKSGELHLYAKSEGLKPATIVCSFGEQE
ncbi:MAG: glycoside hydrolase family 2 protein [Clostridiales bacterium]|nr:glycoside hydrolase family 2 protein [Clostridiales bacterium]